VSDYPQQERLRLEKEILGFYLSDHPLKAISQSARVLAPVNLGDLTELEPQSVSAVVMVTALKTVTTKKGDPMAILTLEDLTGQVEAVVFPKSYAQLGSLIQPDTRLMIWGKLDKQDENRVQLIVEDAAPIEVVQMVMLELDPTVAADAVQQHRLRNILKAQNDHQRSGKVPVIAIIGSGDQRQLVRFGYQFRVKDDQATVQALLKAGFRARRSSLMRA
jgi:DNA polymerase-3 subunit alpha